MTVGIDAIQFSIPKIHLPIRTLAIHRNIDPDKLEKGLGLINMTFPDVHQDVVTFAANATLKLLKQEQINPKEIDRIYVGTESSVDGSKPIATYVAELIEQVYGAKQFQHCDLLDMTFACIGAVDALQNCIDFIRLNPDKKAIVIATDIAKYDLESAGEYTQGAGAVAMLVTDNPRILEMGFEYGISSESVFDFFKPIQYLSKDKIVDNSGENMPWHGILETEIPIFKEQPVFDGPYSNSCYVNRVKDAYNRLKKIKKEESNILFDSWLSIQMHLPYAFQGRRMFTELYALENPDLLNTQVGETNQEKIKALSKTEEYKEFINQKIKGSEKASGMVGNMYTGSIFMGLISSLSVFAQNKKDIIGETLGFFAYGSGSKSKVFEGKVASRWFGSIENLKLFESLESVQPISFETYEKLHRKELKSSVLKPANEFVLTRMEQEIPTLKGARYYQYIS